MTSRRLERSAEATTSHGDANCTAARTVTAAGEGAATSLEPARGIVGFEAARARSRSATPLRPSSPTPKRGTPVPSRKPTTEPADSVLVATELRHAPEG